MGIYIKKWSLADWKELLKWAKIGANNAMIGEFAEVEEVPPHGRLIDADEMFVEFVMEGQRSKRYKLGEKWELNGEEIRSVISRLPTIIPAEEGET